MNDQKNLIRQLLATIILLGAGMIAVAIVGSFEVRSARTTSTRLARHCTFEDLRLEDEIADLTSTNPNTRKAASIAFANIMADDWRSVALCVPDGYRVARGCVTEDVSCMIAAVETARAGMYVRWAP